jgi:hypothetical protein
MLHVAADRSKQESEGRGKSSLYAVAAQERASDVSTREMTKSQA